MEHSIVIGDATNLSEIKDISVDLIIADPPYNLSKKKPLKSDFTKYTTMDKGWDIFSNKDYRNFTTMWINECSRVMKPGASLFICGSIHNLSICQSVTETFDLKPISLITWYKPSCPPSITRRQPTSSTEFLLWVSKGKKWTYNYEIAKSFNDGKQLRDLWVINPARGKETGFGKWRSQKPIELISRCIQIASNPGDTVLDLFAGTGTTSYCCINLDRSSIAYEKDPEAIKILKSRLQSLGKSINVSIANKPYSGVLNYGAKGLGNEEEEKQIK